MSEEEKLAIIGHAKLLFNYIKRNHPFYPCLVDDLMDFIDDHNNNEIRQRNEK